MVEHEGVREEPVKASRNDEAEDEQPDKLFPQGEKYERAAKTRREEGRGRGKERERAIAELRESQ